MDMLSGHGGEGLHAMDYYTFCEHQVGQVSINYAEFNFSWWQLSSRSCSLSHHGAGPGRVGQLTAGVESGYRGHFPLWAGWPSDEL